MTAMTLSRVAVLMASYNRQSKTLAAIASVLEQRGRGADYELDIVLCDDKSPDGTAAEVQRRFPQVQVLHGTGQLYWSRSMRRAFEWASGRDYGHFLWLNDDVALFPHAVADMLRHSREAAGDQEACAVIVGTTCEPGTSEPSYGGWMSVGASNRARLKRVEAGPERTKCDTMNGNCVLVPAAVARTVGNLDPVFVQGLADLDYGFRIVDAGFVIYVCPGFVGSCARGATADRETWLRGPLREGWKEFTGPKVLPFRPWAIFTRRYSGALWVLSFLGPYVKYWSCGIAAHLSQRRRRAG